VRRCDEWWEKMKDTQGAFWERKSNENRIAALRVLTLCLYLW